jgi:hypothetical protein
MAHVFIMTMKSFNTEAAVRDEAIVFGKFIVDGFVAFEVSFAAEGLVTGCARETTWLGGWGSRGGYGKRWVRVNGGAGTAGGDGGGHQVRMRGSPCAV